MDEPRPWHRWFGLSWMDFFHGTATVVEPEKDLAVQQQRLDVLIVGRGPAGGAMPDGMEDLAAHNLITFKSHHEAMDEWAVLELLAHYVAYRKLVSPSTTELLPEENFRLFAVCARSPQGMAGRDRVAMARLRDGVYDLLVPMPIRLLVVRELPREERNALFGGTDDLLRYGYENHQFRSPGTGSLMSRIIHQYLVEGTIMPDKLQEFIREETDRMLKELPVERRLEGVSPADLAKVLTPERLKGLPVEALIAALPPELQELVRRPKKEE